MQTTPAGKDIFDDLGRSPEKAASLKVRRDLMRVIVDTIGERCLTQAKAAKIFGVSQPRVSDLVRGRISQFTIDALVAMLAKAGIEVAVTIGPSAPAAVPVEIATQRLMNSFPPEVQDAFQKVLIQPADEDFSHVLEDAPGIYADSRRVSFHQAQIIH